MKWMYFLLCSIFFYSCEAQKNQNKAKMEKFNIQEFNTKKSGGEYTRTSDDGTVITSFGNESGYYEKSYPREGWFYTYKEFYSNGNLKQGGTLFRKGDYQAGVWTEYDMAGNKTKETDFDKPYHLNIESVFKIMKDKKIKFLLTDPFNTVTRAVVNARPTWFIKWKEKQDRVERLEIDDASGKIIKQDFYIHQENN
jgi:hypothetical protein